MTKGLKEELNLFDATMISIGSMVGAGIFTTTGFMAERVADGWYILLLWIMGGFLTLLGSLCYGEMGAMFPFAGGDYIYIKESYGKWAGFLFGWIGFCLIQPGSTAATSIGLSSYLLSFLELPEGHPFLTRGMSLLFVVILASIGYRGVKRASLLQNLTTGLTLFIMVGTGMTGLIWGSGSFDHFRGGPSYHPTLDDLGSAMPLVIYSYSGWFSASYIASEIKNPKRNLPLALLLGSLSISLLYVFVNVFYLYGLDPSGMKGNVDVAREASKALFGPLASSIATLGIIVALFGNLNSIMLTGPRIYHAMAMDGLFFEVFSRVHPRYHTPHLSIMAQALASSVFILWGDLESLLVFISFVLLISSMVGVLGVFVLRIRNPHRPRPYKTPGYPLTIALFILGYLWIASSALKVTPTESFLGVAFILMGIPVYFLLKKRAI